MRLWKLRLESDYFLGSLLDDDTSGNICLDPLCMEPFDRPGVLFMQQPYSITNSASGSGAATGSSAASSGLTLRLQGSTSRPVCSDCADEGRNRLAHSAKWCGSFCKYHARLRGLEDPNGIPRTRAPSRPGEGRSRLAHCPDCLAAGRPTPARPDKWCRGYCIHHAHTRGFAAPGTVAPNAFRDKYSKTRWPRCRDPQCNLRARCVYKGDKFCKRHAAWKIKVSRVSSHAKRHCNLPPKPRTALGQWWLKQVRRWRSPLPRTSKLALTKQQRQVMAAVPSGVLTYTEKIQDRRWTINACGMCFVDFSLS